MQPFPICSTGVITRFLSVVGRPGPHKGQGYNQCVLDAETLILTSTSLQFDSRLKQFHLFTSVFHYYLER